MATTQSFAFNPSGIPISGTTQSGDFILGQPITGFTNSPQFWNGPDEELGYIIAQPVPLGNQPNPVGIPAYLGFFRTDGFSDLAFTEMVSTVAGISFVNSSDAYNWLDANGYYTTFNPTTPTPTPTITTTQTITPTNTNTPTPSITASQTVTPTNTNTPTVTNTETPTNTPTPTSTDLSSLTTYTISGCSSSNVLVANLLSPGLAPNDVFYLDFTGATTTECYKIINKVNDTPTDGSSPVTFYASCAECLDQTTTVYSISGCTNMVTLNADLLSPNLFPGDVLYIEFTGSTLDGCYTVIEKMFNTVPTDTVLTNTTYSSCGLCEAAIVTPTPTVTETPTPTPTQTETPTQTPTTTQTPTQTAIPKFTVINNSTLDRTVTQINGLGPWTLTTGSYPVGAGETAYGLTHPALVNAGLDQLVIQFGGSLAIDISITKNGSPYTASSSPAPFNVTASQINYFVDNPSDFIQANDVIVITITDTI